MADYYGTSLRDIMGGAQQYNINAQNASIAAQDAEQRRQMNAYRLSRLPVEAGQADWEFEQKKKQAQLMQDFQNEWNLNGPDAAMQKYRGRGVFTPMQELELDRKAQESKAKKAATQGMAREMFPQPAVPAGGPTIANAEQYAPAASQYAIGQSIATGAPDTIEKMYQERFKSERDMAEQAAKDKAEMDRLKAKPVTGATGRKQYIEVYNQAIELGATPEQAKEYALGRIRKESSFAPPQIAKLNEVADALRAKLAITTDPEEQAQLESELASTEAAIVLASSKPVTEIDPTGKKTIKLVTPSGKEIKLGTQEPQAVTEANVTEAQKEIADAELIKNSVASIKPYYKPSFLTYEERGMNWVTNLKEKAGLGDGKAQADLKEYYKFKKKVEQQNFTLRKSITGTAGSEKEFAQIAQAYLNGEMGQSEFEAALEILDENADITIKTNRPRAARTKSYSETPAPKTPPPSGRDIGGGFKVIGVEE